MHNLAAAVFAQACTEIDRALQITGGTRTFAYGLPGAGDLYVTCTGSGRSVRLGRLLGLGYSYVEAREIMVGETLESAYVVQVIGHTLPKLEARGILSSRDLPLMRALVDTIVNDRPLDLPLEGFFPPFPV
jgi:glycerol-3-phosphate dehydrogenase (NAD(P)+)